MGIGADTDLVGADETTLLETALRHHLAHISRFRPRGPVSTGFVAWRHERGRPRRRRRAKVTGNVGTFAGFGAASRQGARVGIARALQRCVSNKNRLLTIVLSAAALAGLTYGVTRRGLQRRSLHSSASHTLASGQRAPLTADFSPVDSETPSARATRPSTPDPLDVAMNLDGLFDAPVDESALTVRTSEHVPLPLGGDDRESPDADDLGLAWLAQATQAEYSMREADLVPALEDIAFAEQDADPEEDADPAPQDEHEDFRRSRA